jgi:hypothetical protein
MPSVQCSSLQSRVSRTALSRPWRRSGRSPAPGERHRQRKKAGSRRVRTRTPSPGPARARLHARVTMVQGLRLGILIGADHMVVRPQRLAVASAFVQDPGALMGEALISEVDPRPLPPQLIGTVRRIRRIVEVRTAATGPARWPRRPDQRNGTSTTATRLGRQGSAHRGHLRAFQGDDPPRPPAACIIFQPADPQGHEPFMPLRTVSRDLQPHGDRSRRSSPLPRQPS